LEGLHRSLLRFLRPHKKHLESFGYGAFEPEPADYWWASSVINTRACYMAIDPSIQDYNTLVPFADFLNHANVDSQGSFSEAEDCYQIVTRTPFRKGEQVFISYGKHDNETLIHLYGFAMPNNSEEIFNFVDPFQWLDKNIRLKEEKDKCLQEASLNSGFFAWPSGELSWNLEVALKVYLLDEDEFLGEKKHLRLILGEEVVTNHPRRHLQFINDFISLLLSIYPTTLEQDQVLLDAIENRNGERTTDEQLRKKQKKQAFQEQESCFDKKWEAIRNAMILRIGQKQILSQVLSDTRAALDQLPFKP